MRSARRSTPSTPSRRSTPPGAWSSASWRATAVGPRKPAPGKRRAC
jgi:hypothetical protein